MRKVQKKQTEKLLCLVGQMHEEIRKELEAGRTDAAAGCLGQCQETALWLGELIEQSEGKGHVTISLLEEYCELVYQLYEEIRQGQGIRVQKAYEKLMEALNQIKNSVKNEIRLHTEAVFLPYKAAMWDSLESVWKAADADPDCDAYVIPIPYFDRRPDGSFGEEHYEGDQYPDYVSVMHWQEYDFEHRRPDMIFIHNPYDEHNLVTSVHPFFYSKNLKKYTEKLIYIPYFILNEIDPSDKETVKGIEDLCVVSAVIYADKVIVQSESMRQIYINLMQENMGTDKIPETYWENKILGLGSPKVDKVLNTKREELKIPKDWLQIMQKEDGSWKKIIFYNTSVAALLRYEEKLLEKIQNVFRFFEENKDEAALLWRPHPLMKATLQSMRPKLQKEYEKITAEYQSQGWGIYDDTADVERAIGLCDGYYGDWSSLVRMCQEAGKPVMVEKCADYEIERIMVQDNNCERRVSTHDFAVVGKNIYFFSLHYNGLYCLHMPKKRLEFLGSVPYEEFRMKHLYGPVAEADGKLYMPPMNADEIAVYDIKQRKFDKIALDYKYRNKGAKFFGVVYYDRKMFFIPCWYRYLVVLDIDSGQTTYLDQWYRMLYTKEMPLKRLVRNGYFIKNKMVYLASMADNSLIKISAENYNTEIIKIGNDSDGFVDMCFDEQEKCIWFLKKSRPVIERWDLETHKTKSYEVRIDCYKQTGEYPFINLICDQERLYLISFQSNVSIIMDKKEEEFFPAEWDANNVEYMNTEWGANNYFAKKLGKNTFLIGTIGEQSFLLIRKGKMTDKICLEDPLQIYRYNCQRGRIIREDAIFCMKDFLKIITVRENLNGEHNPGTSNGMKIYEKMNERKK